MIGAIDHIGFAVRDIAETLTLYRDVLGLPVSHLDGEWAIFPLESGKRDYFEIYGPGHTDERLMTAASDGPIAAFAVDDLLEARAELEAAGTEMISDVIWASDAFANPSLEGFGWFFFRAPDGNVYILQQEGLPQQARRIQG